MPQGTWYQTFGEVDLQEWAARAMWRTDRQIDASDADALRQSVANFGARLLGQVLEHVQVMVELVLESAPDQRVA